MTGAVKSPKPRKQSAGKKTSSTTKTARKLKNTDKSTDQVEFSSVPVAKTSKKIKKASLANKEIVRDRPLTKRSVKIQKQSSVIPAVKAVIAPSAFDAKSFEEYALRHWGRMNLYFLLPASITPPLLGLWLTPAGMTTGFAMIVFLAVWGAANFLAFLLITLMWAIRG